MYMGYRIMLTVIPVVLGLTSASTAVIVEIATTTNQAFAWGPDFANWNGGHGGSDYGRNGENIDIGEPAGPQSYDNGWNAGLQDAIYDHDNSLQYNPVGSCLSCHSEIYWHGFHAGYDKQWNSYNEQITTQGTSINIYGNNNYVSTNQDSTQASGSSLLRSIGQGLCNLAVGCNAGAPGPGPIQESFP